MIGIAAGRQGVVNVKGPFQPEYPFPEATQLARIYKSYVVDGPTAIEVVVVEDVPVVPVPWVKPVGPHSRS
jgi:hypothetical protein|tara:strand:+ start:323 stop:535 length:213 start_codon:yes stop_codon:yes gene_type:complete